MRDGAARRFIKAEDGHMQSDCRSEQVGHVAGIGRHRVGLDSDSSRLAAKPCDVDWKLRAGDP